MAPSSSSSSFLKLIIISILLFSFTLFLLLFPPKPLSNTPSKTRLLLESSSPPPPPPDARCSAVRDLPADRRCAAALAHCQGDSPGLLNYAALHFCLLAGDSRLSLPALSLLLLLHFYFLVSAARDHFSPVVTRLAAHLRLSPSMAAVTLLALGSGSPDVFACVAAVRGGHARTGLGAILSAGASSPPSSSAPLPSSLPPFRSIPAPLSATSSSTSSLPSRSSTSTSAPRSSCGRLWPSSFSTCSLSASSSGWIWWSKGGERRRGRWRWDWWPMRRRRLLRSLQNNWLGNLEKS